MVVMVRCGAAAVDRFAGVGAHDVHQIGRGQRLQGAIHRGQPHVLTAPAQFVVQVLSGPELLDGVEQSDDGSPLPRCAHPGAYGPRLTAGNHFA